MVCEQIVQVIAVEGADVFNPDSLRSAENRTRAIFVVLLILSWAVNRLSPYGSILQRGSFIASALLAVSLVVVILKQVRRSHRK